MRGFALVALLGGCGFSLDIGDNTGAGDARVDMAIVPDSDPDAPKIVCPTSYRVIGTSMYTVLEPTNFRAHVAACASHGTHLAVIDNAQEAVDLIAFGRTVNGVNTNSRFYIGLVQAPLQENPNDSWIDLQDRDANPALWATSGGPDEPNDGADGNEGNHQEQVAALQLDRDAIVDLDSGENVRAYCECDGIPVGPKAAGYLASPSL